MDFWTSEADMGDLDNQKSKLLHLVSRLSIYRELQMEKCTMLSGNFGGQVYLSTVSAVHFGETSGCAEVPLPQSTEHQSQTFRAGTLKFHL